MVGEGRRAAPPVILMKIHFSIEIDVRGRVVGRVRLCEKNLLKDEKREGKEDRLREVELGWRLGGVRREWCLVGAGPEEKAEPGD